MPSTFVSRLTLALSPKQLAPIALLLLGGCSWLPSFPSWPDHLVYKVDIQQGTVITQEMAAQLRPGMTREQVRFVLGTPAIIDPFHATRWEYPYYFKPGRGPTVERRFTVFFDKDEHLDRFQGDPLLTESEFITNRINISVDEAKTNGVGAPSTAGITPASSQGSGTAPATTPPDVAPANGGVTTPKDETSPSFLDRIRGFFSDSPAPESKPTAPAIPNGPNT
jgi:outer membrane protein assembly factor BamE